MNFKKIVKCELKTIWLIRDIDFPFIFSCIGYTIQMDTPHVAISGTNKRTSKDNLGSLRS